MPEAYIVDAVRTPVGKRGGGLSQVHPADLGAHVLKAIVERNDLDPMVVEDVVFGCVDQLGPQAGDIARTCWLAAGLPEAIPGTTVDRQCGSSQQAVHFAAQGRDERHAGRRGRGRRAEHEHDPDRGRARPRPSRSASPTRSPGPRAGSTRYGTQEISQFRGAELIAEKWDISREDMEAFALESHERAIRAIDEGRFEREIVPLGDASIDEGPRRGTSLEKMAQLPTLTRRRSSHRRGRVADLRRRVGAARDVGARGEGPRRHAPGAHPPPQRARRRPRAHAHRADPGDGVRAREDRA